MSGAIGEMSDERAKLVLLRAIYEATGEVPVEASRDRDGGYRVTIHMNPGVLDSELRCGGCSRPPTHNLHRPDEECDDPDEHLRDLPYELHHPFLLAPERPAIGPTEIGGAHDED